MFLSLKKELVKICHKVYEKGFVSAYDGNISALTSDRTVLITRSSVCKGEVTEDDIYEVDLRGRMIRGRGKVTTEIKIHLFVYEMRRDVKAVVHCHPVFATAFSAAGEGLTKNVFPEVILTMGKVPLCDYATPSTDDVPKSMMPYIQHAWAFLLKNHGAVTLGPDLQKAYYKMEKLEHAAKIIFIARLLGGEQEIPKNKLAELLRISEEVYGIKPDDRNIF